MRELKRQLTPEEKLRRSGLIMEQVQQLPAFRKAKVVLLWKGSSGVNTGCAKEG